MTLRYCATCATEVEEREGHCLLGHPLRLQPLTSSLTDLRAEVDKAFEQAREQISTALEAAPATPSAGPPPPPPPHRRSSIFETAWEQLEEDEQLQNDPISAFAPAPRMDWGPRRDEREKKGRFGRSRPKLA